MIEEAGQDESYKILVLDDEEPIIKAMTRVLHRMPKDWLIGRCEIHGFTDPDEALASMRDREYDLIITDLRMPRIGGIEFLQQTLSIQPEAMRIVISGQADLPTVMSAINDAQVYRFIGKPWNDTELLMGVAQALRNSTLQRENQRLADLVRKQRSMISQHEAALRELEAESPGITHVERDETGAIMLDESEYEDD